MREDAELLLLVDSQDACRSSMLEKQKPKKPRFEQ